MSMAKCAEAAVLQAAVRGHAGSPVRSGSLAHVADLGFHHNFTFQAEEIQMPSASSA